MLRTIHISIVFIIFLLIPATAASAEEGGPSKENLDLPWDAIGTGDTDPDEDPVELFIFFRQQYEGDGIFFSCDRSSSMNNGTKWKMLQKELIRNITEFSDRVQFGIAFFDAGLVKFPSTGRPAEANPSMKAAAIAFVLTLSPGRGTCPKNGLFTALSFANQSTARRKIIVHLADGMTTCPGHDPTVYGQETLAEAKQRNTQNAQVNTICIGPPGQVDEKWMQRLAARNGGSYARIVTQ